ELYQSFYLTNLLSGIKTHERNFIGNSFNALANVLTTPFAAGYEAVAAPLQGRQREAYFGEIPATMMGTWLGTRQGLRNMIYTIQHGFRPSSVKAAGSGQFDRPRKELPGGLVTNYPGRFLEGGDELFREIARQQELYAGAYAQARKEGHAAPKRITRRMAELLTPMKGRTAEAKLRRKIIGDRADIFAARAVFQSKPGPFMKKVLGLKGDNSPLLARLLLLMNAPFIKTPSQILIQGVEASPVGFFSSAANQRECHGSSSESSIGTAPVPSH
ncbi:hypothetical protein LCGC14_3139010, partial [marine sediment metagenome]